MTVELINGRTPEEIKAAVLCTERGTIPDCENCPYCGVVDEQGFRSFACYQAEFDLIAYVERLEAKRPKWISVKDRLPEIREDGSVDAVLVTDGFLIHMAYCADGLWLFCDSGEMKEPMFYCVTHWMPLPEPPEEETNETTD